MKKGNITAIAAIIIVLIIAGVFVFFNKSQTKSNKIDSGSPGQEAQEKSQNVSHGEAPGQVLAGHQAQYMVFNKSEYEKALKAKKVVFLDFYANWCPICREEDPQFKAGFNSLTTDRIVGFRVNYNDTDTDEDEKKLAQEFGVTHQNTKFIFKDGKVVLGPTLEEWDKETFLKEINKVL